MISPFIVGMIADRFFATQKVFGFLHLLGGIFLYNVGQATDWSGFYPFLLLHLICYMPTLALSNSLCFQNMEDPQRQFPPIRTLGTIGWIASGILVGSSFFFENEFRSIWPAFLGGSMPPEEWSSISMTSLPFEIGAAVSILLGLYSFSLPNTPPKLKGKKVTTAEVLGLKALALMKDKSFAIFIICSFLLCIPLSFLLPICQWFSQGNGRGKFRRSANPRTGFRNLFSASRTLVLQKVGSQKDALNRNGLLGITICLFRSSWSRSTYSAVFRCAFSRDMLRFLFCDRTVVCR